ncbi:MAG: response regulator transcription factor, partial [Chloroflexota bacterium]|nr:response regulator transcription factor [Chloroflexota bacterium]
LAARARPDVVLLDLELPGLDGVAAIPRLVGAGRDERPSGADRTGGDGPTTAGPGTDGTRVLVFTAYDTDERVFGALEAGASGYLLKGAPVEEIVRAIREVRAGGSHLAPRVAALVVGAVGRGRRSEPALTEREREVLRLVADGLQNKQIARALGISERTVKYHVTAILTRLGADNRAQAVAIATGRGLLEHGRDDGLPRR